MGVMVGINGFGRIGRTVLHIAAERPDEIDVRGINLRKADLSYMAYMLKYDSVFGRFQGRVETYEDGLCINGRKIRVFSETEASAIPWDECGAQYIIESTGAFNTTELASGHFLHGAKKAVITAPATDKLTPTFVMGVNHTGYSPDMNVVSNASCTTNCLAPLARVLHDNFGIVQGMMVTVHSATAKQKPVDARNSKDYRIGRSVFNNIIPSTTGAAKAVGIVIPELAGKLTGTSLRIPTPNVSMVDLTCQFERPAPIAEIRRVIREASLSERWKGIIDYTEDSVVSSDFCGDKHTCIFDANTSLSLNDNFAKVMAWYDNEWGYSCKVLDLICYMAKVDGAKD